MSHERHALLLIFLTWAVFLGAVFTGRLASDNWKSRENSDFSNSLKVKRVGKFQ